MLLLWLALQTDLDNLRSDDAETREAAAQALIERADAEPVWPLLFSDDVDLSAQAFRIVMSIEPYAFILGRIFDGSARDAAKAAELFHAMHADHLRPDWRAVLEQRLERIPRPLDGPKLMAAFQPFFLEPPVNLNSLDGVLRLEEGALVVEPADAPKREPVCVRLLRRLANTDPMRDLSLASFVSDLCDDGLSAAFDAHKDSTHPLWRHGRVVLACMTALRPKEAPAAARRASLELLQDGDWPRRALGAQALANALPESKAEWAEACESKDPLVQYAAAYVLRTDPDAVYDPALARLLDAAEDETLIHAMHAAFRIMPRDAMPLPRMLRIAASHQGQRFEDNFKQIADARLKEALLDLVEKGLPHERVFGLVVFPAFKDEATVADVARLAAREKGAAVLDEYVDAFAQWMPAHPAAAALEALVLGETAEPARRAAIVLGARGDKRAFEFFERHAAGGSAAVRTRAIVGLEEFARYHPTEKEGVLRILDELANDADADVARTAKDRAGAIRDLQTLDVIGTGGGSHG